MGKKTDDLEKRVTQLEGGLYKANCKISHLVNQMNSLAKRLKECESKLKSK